MLRIDTENGQRFAGLRDEVLYRTEVGLAIVDDGERIVRIQQSVFARLSSRVEVDASTSGGAQLVELVERYPTIFRLFEEPRAARASLLEREV